MRLRDAAGALSLANLCMLGAWNDLLNNAPAHIFLLENPPSRTQLVAAACDTALIGLVIYGLILWAHRLDQRFHGASFLVWPLPFVLLLSLRPFVVAVRFTASAQESWSPSGIATAFAVLFAAAVFMAGKNILSLGLTALVTLSPMVAIEGVRAMMQSRRADYANRPLLHRNPNDSLPRVVWIIFDELDYRLSFPERPPTVDMPEFDRLRAQSLFASDAFSPSDSTQTSVIALLTGRAITSLELKGPASANFNGTPLDLQPTIFSTVHGMGGNAAVVGWYLPYCRIFSQDLSECSWHEIDSILGGTHGTFTTSAAYQLQSLFEYGYFSIFPRSLSAEHRIEMLNAMRERALQDVGDPSLNLVFLHLPAPHPPHFYDRHSHTLTKRNAGPAGYLDSLVLADDLLRDIRNAMATARLWDSTTVLVSSDHSFRTSRSLDGKHDARVPFLLKLAGQTTSSTYQAPLQTIVTKPLLEQILQRRVGTPDEAAKWLAMHSQ